MDSVGPFDDRTRAAIGIVIVVVYVGLVAWATATRSATAGLLVDLAFALVMGGMGVLLLVEQAHPILEGSGLLLIASGFAQLYVSLAPAPLFGDGVPGILAVLGVGGYFLGRSKAGGAGGEGPTSDE